MRKRYDQELAKWKRQAVDYNDYQRYGALFDRTIPLDDKKPLMVKERKADPNRREGLKGDPKRQAIRETLVAVNTARQSDTRITP